MFNRSRILIPYLLQLLVSEHLRADGFVMGFGFKLNSSLNTKLYIDMISCKMPKILGYMMILTKDFTLKLLSLYVVMCGRLLKMVQLFTNVLEVFLVSYWTFNILLITMSLFQISLI